MASEKITYSDKTTGDTFTGSEATEIKTVVNAHADELDNTYTTTEVNDLLDEKQDNAIVISSNATATNDSVLHVVATATIADPSPVEGLGFTVLVRNGTATVGGTAYATAGTIIKRIYHSGSWASYMYSVGGGDGGSFDPATDTIGTITESTTDIADNDTISVFAGKTKWRINAINLALVNNVISQGTKVESNIVVWDNAGRAISSGYGLNNLWVLGQYIPNGNLQVYNTDAGDALKISLDYLTSTLSPKTVVGKVGTATGYSYLSQPKANNDGDTLRGFTWNAADNINGKVGIIRKPYAWNLNGKECITIESSGVINLKGLNVAGSGNNIVVIGGDSTSSTSQLQIKCYSGQASNIVFNTAAGTALTNMKHYNVGDSVTTSYNSWQVCAGIYITNSGTSNIPTASLHFAPIAATARTPMRFDISTVEKTTPLDGDIWYSSTGAMNGWKFRQGAQTMILGGQTGWSAMTGTATKGGGDTATVTLPQLAEKVKAILDFLGTSNMNLLRA